MTQQRPILVALAARVSTRTRIRIPRSSSARRATAPLVGVGRSSASTSTTLLVVGRNATEAAARALSTRAHRRRRPRPAGAATGRHGRRASARVEAREFAASFEFGRTSADPRGVLAVDHHDGLRARQSRPAGACPKDSTR